MPQIRPITDLRNTTEISELCHSHREPVFITKNGYGDLVIMSIEAYDELLEAVAADAAVTGSNAESAQSRQLHHARDILKEVST